MSSLLGYRNNLRDRCLTNSQRLFSIFKSEMIISKVLKPDNFESYNSVKHILPLIKVLIQISFDLNLSSNQSILIFLLYKRQHGWLIASNKFTVNEFFKSEWTLLLICMILYFM